MLKPSSPVDRGPGSALSLATPPERPGGLLGGLWEAPDVRGPDPQRLDPAPARGGGLKPPEKTPRYPMIVGNSVARGCRRGCPGRLDPPRPVGSFWCQSGGLSPRFERPCIWSAALSPVWGLGFRV